MTPSTAAFAGALIMALGAVAWVRPVGVWRQSRPRDLVEVSSAAVERRGLGCPSWFGAAAERADLTPPVERWWAGALASFGLAVLLGFSQGGPVLAALMGAVVVLSGLGVVRSLRFRRDERIGCEVPDTLDAIARSTRSGLSVVQALAALDGAQATRADQVFASVAGQVGRGASLRSSLEGLVEQYPLHPVRLAVAALIVGTETGAAPARAVEGVAETLRDRAALDREASAHSSQARASVAVLVIAPLGFGVFAIATDPRVGDFLFRSPVGWICLVVGLGLNAAGAAWMRRIMGDSR